MILVTLGSQKFQFNRILIEIDKLIESKVITNQVIAQIGASDYIPKNFKYFKFLPRDEFNKYMNDCEFVITHAGTGAIITALKNEKKVIAIPRLAEFGEHVDDHQLQIVDEFRDLNFIEPVYKIEQLEKAISIIKNKKYNKYVSNTTNIVEDIINFIGD